MRQLSGSASALLPLFVLVLLPLLASAEIARHGASSSPSSAAAAIARLEAQTALNFSRYDCLIRALALEYAAVANPGLTAAQLGDARDALEGSPHFGNYSCGLSLGGTFSSPSSFSFSSSSAAATAAAAAIAAAVTTVYVAPDGDDARGNGSLAAPFRSVHCAVAAARAAAAPPTAIVMRGGTYFFGEAALGTLQLTAADSGTTFASFPGESAWISGGAPLPAGLVWTPVNVSGGANVWAADLSRTQFADVPGLRIDGARLVRARFPNANPETDGFGSTLTPAWTAPDPVGEPVFFSPAEPTRNDTSDLDQRVYSLGVGGGCAKYDPPAGWACGNHTNVPYPGFEPMWPKGMSLDASSLPGAHLPYSTNLSGSAIVHAWRALHWFTRQHEVASYDAATNSFLFGRGGWQGAEGTTSDAEFFIESVLEELDVPGEWFFNSSTRILTLWHNASSGTPPPPFPSVVSLHLQVLVNISGGMGAPARNLSFVGLGFRDAAHSFLEPHGMPQNGDWGLPRSGALLADGTEGLTVASCAFSRLDNNAVFLLGYHRAAAVRDSEFSWLGASGVILWGRTTGGPVAGMGPDTRAGEQPRGTLVERCVFRELGIFVKQSSAFFQAEAGLSVVRANLAYNGPRAAFNVNDASLGGSLFAGNVGFNMCRESGDHGFFNSWQRTPFFNDLRGYTSTRQLTDEISGNLFIANYNAMAAVDTDDGSAYFHVHHNVFSFAPFACKSDIGGHGKTFNDNVLFVENLFDQWNSGPFGLWFFLTQPQVDGAQDAFFDNHLVQIGDGVYAAGQLCNSSTPSAPGSGGGYSAQAGFIPSGGDVVPPGPFTLLAAQALCNATPACEAVTIASADPTPPGQIGLVYFKGSATVTASSGWFTFVNDARAPPPGGVTILHNNTVYTPNASVAECGMPLAQWQALSPYNDPLTTENALPSAERIIELARVVLGLQPAA